LKEFAVLIAVAIAETWNLLFRL